jgi:hypothetical protein
VEPAALDGSAPERGERCAIERWFELTSVVPLAGFALLHVAAYGRVLWDGVDFGAQAHPAPWAIGAEVLLVWLPFAFHVAAAPGIWAQRRRQAPGDATERALLGLHRSAGLVLLGFLLDHFVRFRLPVLTGQRLPAETVLALAADLSSTSHGVPVVAGLHLLGVLALAVHLGFGLGRVAARHPSAPRAIRPLAVLLAVFVGLVGTLTVIRLAAG